MKDDLRKQILLSEFKTELRVAVETVQRKIAQETKSAKSKSTLVKNVSRREVVEAFHVLKLDTPRSGKKIDIGMVRKQQRKLAILYHPDRNNGDHSKQLLFNQVIDAFDKIEKFTEKYKSL